MTTAANSSAREVSTIDVVKLVAVVLMLADHVGLYVFDNTWLRIAGRPVAVIFGFLIGYSASTRVPPSWVGLGIGLTLLNRWLFPDGEDRVLDILVCLALTRIAMPFFDGVHKREPLLLVPIVAVLGLLTTSVNEFIEYGTEVPMLAILGAAVRLDQGRRGQTAARQAVALAAIVAISLISIRHFHLVGVQAAACVAIVALTITVLAGFRLHPVSVPAGLAPLLRWNGRHTLWIYAVHLAALQLLAWWAVRLIASD